MEAGFNIRLRNESFGIGVFEKRLIIVDNRGAVVVQTCICNARCNW